jgi:hypothetical protein
MREALGVVGYGSGRQQRTTTVCERPDSPAPT